MILFPTNLPPYPISFKIGYPKSDKWTRIWWVFPVISEHSIKEESVASSKDNFFNKVFASFASFYLASSWEHAANTASFIDTQYIGLSVYEISSGKLPWTLARYIFLTTFLLLASWNCYAIFLFFDNKSNPDVNLSNLWRTKINSFIYQIIQ